MLATSPGGTMALADVYGQAGTGTGRADIGAVVGPVQGSVASASANLLGNSVSVSAPAFALIFLFLVLVGVRIAFEFSTQS